MKPAISVVIPAFNASAYIAKAVESALRQTCKPKDIVVVDDGSTDGTALEASRTANDECIKVIRTSQNGPSAARNRGAMEARGDYICFLDADDILLPGCLARSTEVIEKKPEIDLIFHNNVVIAMEDTVSPDFGGYMDLMGYWEKSGQWAILEKKGDLIPTGVLGVYVVRNAFGLHLYTIFTILNGATVRKDLFLELGGFDERLSMGEDIDLWFRIAERGIVAVSKERNAVYRRRKGSNVDRTEDYLKSRIEIPQRYYRRFLLDRVQTRLFFERQRYWYSLYARFLRDRGRKEECKGLIREGFQKAGRDCTMIRLLLSCYLTDNMISCIRRVKHGLRRAPSRGASRNF